jgi:hypothetical protein
MQYSNMSSRGSHIHFSQTYFFNIVAIYSPSAFSKLFVLLNANFIAPIFLIPFISNSSRISGHGD